MASARIRHHAEQRTPAIHGHGQGPGGEDSDAFERVAVEQRPDAKGGGIVGHRVIARTTGQVSGSDQRRLKQPGIARRVEEQPLMTEDVVDRPSERTFILSLIHI